jgi:hypothetical protein
MVIRSLLHTGSIETRSLLRAVGLFLLYVLMMLMASCGPVVITSRPGPPPPPWFYPHRVEVVRYVYFPELIVYFDLQTHTYLYLEGNTWVRHRELPPRFRNYDLNRQRYERIRGYEKDDINPYHQQYRSNSGRSNRSRSDGRVQN